MASKSLGTLTLDLVARTGGFVQGMSKAERESKKWRRQVENDLKAVGRQAGIALGASTAAIAAMTVQTTNLARETSQYARIANTSFGEFQTYAAGARLFGVEQDKLADILKDVNDRVGDFVQTGGGPMADFFENIAPKVGVTADQFARLSGADALQLYVSSLEKANLSQADMTFYMEAMASDATLLLPLLEKNGEALSLIGGAAEDAGALMGGELLRSSDRLQAVMFLLDSSAQGFKNQITEALLPAVGDLAGAFSDVASEGGAAQVVGEGLAFTLREIAAAALGIGAAFELSGKTIGGGVAATGETLLAGLNPFTTAEEFADAVNSGKRTMDIVKEDIANTIDDYAEIINRIRGAGGDIDGPNNQAIIERLTEVIGNAREAAGRLSKANEVSTETTSKNAKAVAKQVEALEFQAETVGKSADQITLLELAAKGATPAQLEMARAALETVSAYEKQKEAQEEAKQVIESLMTFEEQFNEQWADLDRLLEAGLLTWEQYTAAVADAYNEMERLKNKGKETGDELTEFAKQAARNMQDAFADGFFDIMQGDFDNIGESFKRTIDRMVANALAADLADAMFGSNSSSGNGSGDGWIGAIGTFVSGLFGGGKAGGGEVSAGRLYEVNELQPEMLTVGGSDYLMMGSQPGRIDPSPSLSGGGSTVVNFNVTTPNAQSFRQSRHQLMADAKRSLGSA